MSLIEDDKLRELAAVANAALMRADAALARDEPKHVIDATYAEFEKARDAYDAHKRELYQRYGGPITGNEMKYSNFDDSR